MKGFNLKNINFFYNEENIVFKNLSLEISQNVRGSGHTVAIMGESGSGKSTFLKLLLKVLTPVKGEVLFNPVDPIISYLPQDPVLFDHLSPLENAKYFEKVKSYKKFYDPVLFEEVKEILGVRDILKKSNKVSELSGGQRQRIMLLRALSIKPDVIMLDEPTNGLDADVKLEFLIILKKIIKRYNILAIYVTHHKQEVELIADELLYLYKNESEKSYQVLKTSLNKDQKHFEHIDLYTLFNYPSPNVIRIKSDIAKLQISDSNELNYYSMALNNENITFSNLKGFDFQILFHNKKYTTIMVEELYNITLKRDIEEIEKFRKIVIKGRVPIYNNKGLFEKDILLSD